MTTTVQEELGFDADSKLLIVNADDSGLCHSANVATVRAMEAGLVTSTTVMVPCAWFPDMVELWKQQPRLDVGIHLTLNCEWRNVRWAPVAGPAAVPSLVGAEGFLLPSEEQTVADGTVEDVRTEVRAQIERALALGLEPTHIDNHMGPIHYRKEFYEATVEIGAEYGLPMRCVFHKDVAEQHGMPCTESFGMYYAPPGGEREKLALYEAHLRGLTPGLHEMAIHLADDTEEWRRLTYVAEDDHPWRDRVADLEYFTSSETRALIDELGIQLIGYRAVKELWAKRRAAA